MDAADKAKALSPDLLARIGADTVALIVCPGSPLVDGNAMDALTSLKLIGDIDGDRFSDRVDVEAAWVWPTGRSCFLATRFLIPT